MFNIEDHPTQLRRFRTGGEKRTEDEMCRWAESFAFSGVITFSSNARTQQRFPLSLSHSLPKTHMNTSNTLRCCVCVSQKRAKRRKLILYQSLLSRAGALKVSACCAPLLLYIPTKRCSGNFCVRISANFNYINKSLITHVLLIRTLPKFLYVCCVRSSILITVFAVILYK